jgi:hypothetical protein
MEEAERKAPLGTKGRERALLAKDWKHSNYRNSGSATGIPVVLPDYRQSDKEKAEALEAFGETLV